MAAGIEDELPRSPESIIESTRDSDVASRPREGKTSTDRDETGSSAEKNTHDTNPGGVEKPLGFLARVFRVLRGPRVCDSRFEHFIYENLDDYPAGIPRLAAYINSDPNFHIHRGFGQLRNRVILQRQDMLSELERKLIALDAADAQSKPSRLQSRGNDLKVDLTRDLLLNEIHDRLKEYDKLLLREADVKALPRPSKRNHLSLFNYLFNTKTVTKKTAEFVYHPEDLVALASAQEDSWVDGFVEDTINRFSTRKLQRIFASPEQRQKTTDEATHYYSKVRLGILVKAITVILCIFFIMCPVILLFEVSTSHSAQLGVVLVFMFVFPGLLATITKARRHEVFAATAAYCAVLVVFLGNVPTTNFPKRAPAN